MFGDFDVMNSFQRLAEFLEYPNMWEVRAGVQVLGCRGGGAPPGVGITLDEHLGHLARVAQLNRHQEDVYQVADI